ncbi:thioredoxin [Endozoicomonas sp. OPT23]|uniref:thioredoxin n=1 Tax=Endozoicomonas sp. OPT23 TaxID=2072845 RepID=UPI00129BC8A8|nr:thioredoxin [Endozoicomonas sp. OPT23]MRI33124.1 thioredoxin [Endozoicomonas sp. OPT23]
MSVLDIKDSSHFQQISEESDWTLVDFWAPWCGPCKMMSPVLEKVAADYQQQLTTTKANVDDLQQLAGQFGIRGIPTLVLLHKGKAVDQISGAQPEQALSRWLDKHLTAAS